MRKIPTRLRGTNFYTCSAHFAPSFVSNQMLPNAPKWYETQQNLSLGSNGVDRVCSLRKIAMRLRGTNFCTCSAPFAPSFVSIQIVPNAPKWYETQQNLSLESNRVDWVGSLREIQTRLRGSNFWTGSERFALSFVWQLNGPKCTQTVRNAPKHEFSVQWG